MNDLMFDILKRKVDSGQIKVEDIKSAEYKTAIEAYLASKETSEASSAS